MKIDMTYILVLFILFFPKIPLLVVPGISSPLRSDLLFSLFLLLSIGVHYLILSSSKYKLMFTSQPFVFVIIFFLIGMYLSVSKSLPVAIVQLASYGSLFISAILCINNKFRFFRIFLNVNITIHIFFTMMGYENVTLTYVNGFGVISQDTLIGKYGTFGMPYSFVSFLVFSYFILPRVTIYERILIFVCMFTCDSRIGVLAFFVSLMNVKWIFAAPAFVMIGIIFPINNKIGEFFRVLFENGLFNLLSSDPSLAMRFFNLQNFISWFSGSRFVFGGGAQSFLEYSVQYGEPGPLDMGYIRMLTEFGVLGSTMVLIILFFRLRGVMLSGSLLRFYVFIALFTLVNDGPFALKVGSLFFISLLLATQKYGLRSNQKEVTL